MFEGIIYGYPHYVGQVQSPDPKHLARRHRQHKKKHPDWHPPVILEIVTGKDRADLLWNLAFQETIWMFKRHTYRRIWLNGFNKTIPHSEDYVSVGLFGGPAAREWARQNPEKARANGLKGGHTLHIVKDADGKSVHARKMGRCSTAWRRQNPEKARANGLKRGQALTEWRKTQNPEKTHAAAVKRGRANAEWARKNPEKARTYGLKGAQASAAWRRQNPEKVYANGLLGALVSGPLGNHSRWHRAQGIFKLDCSLCMKGFWDDIRDHCLPDAVEFIAHCMKRAA